MPRGYIAFKTLARDEYCSADEYKNHETASEWVRRALDHLDIEANQILGKPRYPLDDQPDGAEILDL
jgi:hypothetical protein